MKLVSAGSENEFAEAVTPLVPDEAKNRRVASFTQRMFDSLTAGGQERGEDAASRTKRHVHQNKQWVRASRNEQTTLVAFAPTAMNRFGKLMTTREVTIIETEFVTTAALATGFVTEHEPETGGAVPGPLGEQTAAWRR